MEMTWIVLSTSGASLKNNSMRALLINSSLGDTSHHTWKFCLTNSDLGQQQYSTMQGISFVTLFFDLNFS